MDKIYLQDKYRMLEMLIKISWGMIIIPGIVMLIDSFVLKTIFWFTEVLFFVAGSWLVGIALYFIIDKDYKVMYSDRYESMNHIGSWYFTCLFLISGCIFLFVPFFQ